MLVSTSSASRRSLVIYLASNITEISLTRMIYSGSYTLHIRRYIWFNPGMGHRLRPHALDHFWAPFYRFLLLGGLQ